nr:hypothetical protein [Tanacetum cinerariifolium]
IHLLFLATKDETSPILKTFITGLENQLSLKVKVIRSDNGTELKNSDLNQFYRMKGIKREFSNRVLVTKPHNQTPYELLHGKTPSIGFMRLFGCHVTILNTLDPLGKFQGKVDEGFLVGYSISSKAFRVFNSRTRIVQETLHVSFLKNKPNVVGSGSTWLFDIDSLTRTMNYQPSIAGSQTNPSAGFQDKFNAEKAREEVDQQYVLFLVWSFGSTNPQNYDGNAAFDGKEHDFDAKKPESEFNVSLSSSAQSRKQDDKTIKEAKGKSHVKSFTGYRALSTEFEDCFDNSSNEVNTASTTVGQDSLNSTNTFSVVECKDITYFDDEDAVGAEADFNNLEPSITVIVDLPHGKRAIGTKWVYRNKKDERGIVVRNKERLVTQGHTQEEGIDYEEVFAPEEVYVYQPPGFKDPDHPDKVYKVIYVDDIIFGATNKDLYKSFEKLMKDKFQMSSMGELTFFLGLQVKQKKDGIFISQDKYVAEILKKFGLTEGKSASTPIDTEKPLLKDPDGEDIDVHTYRSMIGSLMYLTSSRPDIMFACKKQTVVATSSTEAEYVAAASCCAQVNDVTRLQALVDKKKVAFTEAAIKESMSTKRTSWNEFSSSMASAIICLSTGDLLTHTTKYTSLALTQKVFANMKRVGKGFSRVETPLFEGILVGQDTKEEGDKDEHVKDVTVGDDAQGDDIVAHGEVPTITQEPSIPSSTPPTPPPQPPQDLTSTSQVQHTPPQSPQRVGTSQKVDTSDDTVMDDESNQGRMIAKMDKDEC